MDDLPTIIKEMRVDWETVLTDEFNPLHLSLKINSSSTLASDFRDMYHKLEFSMEKIISVNFKGFSDSIISYNQFNDYNKHLLLHLDTSLEISKEIRNENFEVSNIFNENEKRIFYSIKYDVCKCISEIKRSLDCLEDSDDILKKSKLIISCLDLIDSKELIKIKGVDEYRKEIYKRFLCLVDEVNIKIHDFVFKNNIEYLFYYKSVIALGSLFYLEEYFRNNFQKHIFLEIESVILAFKIIEIEPLCRAVCKKIESIRQNMFIIIDNSLEHFEMHKGSPGFFGNRSNLLKFVSDKKYIIELLQNEMEEFIIAYTKRTEIHTFDIKAIVDDINYNSLYNPVYDISSKMGDGYICNSVYSGYTVILAPGPDVVFYLMKYVEDPMLKTFLTRRIEHGCTPQDLENAIKYIDSVFEKDWFRLDYKNRRLVCLESINSIFSQRIMKGEHENKLKSHLNFRAHHAFIRRFKELFTSPIILDDLISKKEGKMVKFEDSLLKAYIGKKDLFLKKIKYQDVIYAILTLKDLEALLLTEESMNLYTLYLESFKKQLNLDFFYFYDLFYRQGNYKANLKGILKVMKIVFDEADGINYNIEELYYNIEYYSKRNIGAINVRSKIELEDFIENLRILDEILGELGFFSSLSELYVFFNKVLNGTSDDDYGRLLSNSLT